MKLKKGDLIFGYNEREGFWIVRVIKAGAEQSSFEFTKWHHKIEDLMEYFKEGMIKDASDRTSDKKKLEEFYAKQGTHIHFLDKDKDIKEQVEQALVMERL